MELYIYFINITPFFHERTLFVFYIVSSYTTKTLSSIMLQEVELCIIFYKEWNMKREKTKLVSGKQSGF